MHGRLVLLALLLVPFAGAAQARLDVEQRSGWLWIGASDGSQSHAMGDAVHRFVLPSTTEAIVAELEWEGAAGAPAPRLTFHLALPGGRSLDRHGIGHLQLRWAKEPGAATPAWIELHVHPSVQTSPEAPTLAQTYEVALSRFHDGLRPAGDYAWFGGPRHVTELDAHPAMSLAPAGIGIPNIAGQILVVCVAVAGLWLLRHRLLVALFFSRIEPDRVLVHPLRAAIHGLARERGTLRLEDARRELRLPNGTFRHHLRLLVAAGKIQTTRRGVATWISANEAEPLPLLRDNILQALAVGPGSRTSELAATLGLSKPVLRYHLRALRRAGQVHVSGVPPERRWMLVPGLWDKSRGFEPLSIR